MSKGEYGAWGQARKVCVIGAGTMGSGIAAHLANLGLETTLLDLTAESIQEAFSRAKQAKPPHFYASETSNKIRLGNFTDNLEWVSEADWVCEAIVEKLNLKRALFEKIEPLLREDAMISTNTSGLQISLLNEGRSESFRKRFIGTHFFNPPRYLKLLELIPTNETDPKAIQAITKFLEDTVARRVVLAKDTPGFIANRFGMWAMFHAIHTAERLHLTLEQVDAITGPFIGRPRSGSFRLNDIVGLDIMTDIASNLMERCPDDPYRDNLMTPKSMNSLIEKGWIGDKNGQGYYRREGRELFAYDLMTHAYRQRVEPNFASIEALSKRPLAERLSLALDLRDEVGEYLRNYLLPVLQYADYLKKEISHNVQDFDRVMMWGFGWEMGPFATIDAVGHKRVGLDEKQFFMPGEQQHFDGKYVKLRPEPQYATLKDFPIVATHENFLIRDLGDGVQAVSTTTKMGVVTPALVDELTHFLEKGKAEKFVLTSEARSFSVGYDLKFLIDRIEATDVKGIEVAITNLQKLGELLEKKKAVAAVFGHCFGGGFELALGCSIIAAHPETTVGLPEAKVGLIPGGRGTVLMRLFNQASAQKVASAALTLAEGTTGNPDQMKVLGVLRSSDVTVYHPDRLIGDAKKLALHAHETVRPPWGTLEGPLAGMIDRNLAGARSAGMLTEYDETIGGKVKLVFSKTNSYEEAVERERAEFLELCFKAVTQLRIKHMLETGKPLRN